MDVGSSVQKMDLSMSLNRCLEYRAMLGRNLNVEPLMVDHEGNYSQASVSAWGATLSCTGGHSLLDFDSVSTANSLLPLYILGTCEDCLVVSSDTEHGQRCPWQYAGVIFRSSLLAALHRESPNGFGFFKINLFEFFVRCVKWGGEEV